MGSAANMAGSNGAPTHVTQQDLVLGRRRLETEFRRNLGRGPSAAGRKVRYRGQELPTSNLATAGSIAVFHEVERPLYYVEWRVKDSDFLYVFLPPRGQAQFIGGPQRFAKVLEQAFVDTIGSYAAGAVEADYHGVTATGQILAQNKSRRLTGTPSFTLRAQGMANRPYAEKLMVRGVLGRLDALMEEVYSTGSGAPNR